VDELFNKNRLKAILMGTKQRKRRIVTSFCVRLDLLEELEERIPKGERSAFLEKLLESALEKPGPVVA
jgi:hypothetical protein